MTSSDTARAPDTGEPDEEERHRLTTLSASLGPSMHNQRGFVLDRAIQKGTVNVVICRLRFQPATWSPPGQAVSAPRPVSPS